MCPCNICILDHLKLTSRAQPVGNRWAVMLHGHAVSAGHPTCWQDCIMPQPRCHMSAWLPHRRSLLTTSQHTTSRCAWRAAARLREEGVAQGALRGAPLRRVVRQQLRQQVQRRAPARQAVAPRHRPHVLRRAAVGAMTDGAERLYTAAAARQQQQQIMPGTVRTGCRT